MMSLTASAASAAAAAHHTPSASDVPICASTDCIAAHD
jgi:hypothetical protein